MSSIVNLKQNEVAEGSFCWTIDKFLKYDLYISDSFQFGRSSDSFLTVFSIKILSDHSIRYLFKLCYTVPEGISLFSKVTLYKICLMDSNGHTICSKWGAALDNGNHNIYPISETEEKLRSALRSEETLTIRFSWYSLNKSCCSREDEIHTTQDLISVKEAVSNSFLEKLSDDLRYLYDSKIDTDCVLKTADAQFPAHTAVLSARSSVFKAMFLHETQEKLTRVVNILDIKRTILDDILKYVYSGKFHGLNSETAVPMYEFADKYAIFELRDQCLCFLQNNLTLENVCDVIILAHTHKKTELEDKILQFIEDRLEDIEKSDSWIQLATINPLLAMKYLTNSYIASKKNKKRKMF